MATKPGMSEARARAVIAENWPTLQVDSVSPLPSYEDENFRIQTSSQDDFVLKVTFIGLFELRSDQEPMIVASGPRPTLLKFDADLLRPGNYSRDSRRVRVAARGPATYQRGRSKADPIIEWRRDPRGRSLPRFLASLQDLKGRVPTQYLHRWC